MSFPKYPKYKDSGIEWLGELPEHWEAHPFRRAISFLTDFEANCSFSTMRNNTTLDEGEPYAWYVRATDLENRRHGFGDENRFCDQTTYEFLKKTRLTGGEFLVTKRGEIGKVYVMPKTDERATLGPNLYLVRLNECLLPEFCNYWFKSVYGKPELELRNQSTTIGALYKDDLKDCLCVYPTRYEQTLIASFLDSETAKIDGLVAEQRRLIELLKEKRLAVISHAVTKGLNPHAPMKPSGIERLGDVPKHWDVMKVKHLTQSIEQGWSPQCEGFAVESENEWGVLKVGCVNGGSFNPNENKLLPTELEPIPSLGISADDLLISRANTRELVGSAAVALKNYPKLLLCDKLYRLRLKPVLGSPCFLSHYLGSTAARGPIEFGATGASASMVNIGQSIILELELAIPPIKEQHSIVASLCRESTKLDALTAEAQRAIDLLQERRTALISAAVTGKIDVRGLVESEAA